MVGDNHYVVASQIDGSVRAHVSDEPLGRFEVDVVSRVHRLRINLADLSGHCHLAAETAMDDDEAADAQQAERKNEQEPTHDVPLLVGVQQKEEPVDLVKREGSSASITSDFFSCVNG